MLLKVPKIFDFSFFELIDNPVFVMDKLGTWLYCNKAFEVFSGLTSDAIKAQIPAIRHFLRSSAAQRCTDTNINFFKNNLQGQQADISENQNSRAVVVRVDKYILRNKKKCASGFIGIIRFQDEVLESYPVKNKALAKAKLKDLTKLSVKELQVLNLIALGYSTKKIAAILKNSVHTISGNQKSIYFKLNVNSKIEAINVGRYRGMLK